MPTVIKIGPVLQRDTHAFDEQVTTETLRVDCYERSGGGYVSIALRVRHAGAELGQIRQVLGR